MRLDSKWMWRYFDLFKCLFSFDSMMLAFLPNSPPVRVFNRNYMRVSDIDSLMKRVLLQLQDAVQEFCANKKVFFPFEIRKTFMAPDFLLHDLSFSHRERRLFRLFGGDSFVIATLAKHINAEMTDIEPFHADTPIYNMASFVPPSGYECSFYNAEGLAPGKYPNIIACHFAKVF